MRKRNLTFFLCVYAFCFKSFAQESFTRNIDDAEGTISPASAAITREMPKEALMSFDKGAAPFYVQLKMYARKLNRSVESGRTQMMESEADLIGISTNEMERLISILNRYKISEDRMWLESLTQECNPVFRNESISNAVAREAIRRIDDDIPQRNALAEATLREVEAAYGSGIADRVLSQINTNGQSITFTKVDQVKQIELLLGGDFQNAFITQCQAL